MIDKTLPPFFNFNEEGTDNGYETIQDFMLSWTMRCAQSQYRDVNELLHFYAKKLIYFLINGNNTELANNTNKYECKNFENDFVINKVLTKRQFKYIDLIVELDIDSKNKKEQYVLNIENKFYGKIGENQLEYSKQIIDEKYKGWKIINLVIWIDNCIINKYPEEYRTCIENKYKVVTIDQIKEYLGVLDTKDTSEKLTGNYIFDEYWIKNW